MLVGGYVRWTFTELSTRRRKQQEHLKSSVPDTKPHEWRELRNVLVSGGFVDPQASIALLSHKLLGLEGFTSSRRHHKPRTIGRGNCIARTK